jgi:hypothetical protein
MQGGAVPAHLKGGMMEKTLTREEKKAVTAKKKKTAEFNCYTHWGTTDEINYLKKIGTHGPPSSLTRRQLLQQYQKIVERWEGKRRWGAIDKKVVMAYLTKELAK